MRLLLCVCAFIAVVPGCRKLVKVETKTALSELRFASDDIVLIRGEAGEPVAPTVLGVADFFSINPPAPEGVVFDASTGAIGGAPLRVQAKTQYTVVATNSTSSAAATIAITIVDRPPTALVYAPAMLTAVRGVPITPLVAMIEGGAPAQFIVTPTLPIGLGVDPQTGNIVGAAILEQAETTYTVRASNAWGEASATVTIGVVEPAPVITYFGEPFIFSVFEPAIAFTPLNSGGKIITCAPADPPAFPRGLVVDPKTCAIGGFPTEVKAEATYPLAVTYSAGVASASVRIAVAAPLEISTPTLTLRAGMNDAYTFTAKYGVEPYLFAKLSGPGAIDPMTGAYQSTNEPGTTIVRVQDSRGHTALATVRTVRSLTNGPVNATYADEANLYVGGTFDAANPFIASRIIAVDATSGDPKIGFDVGDGFDGPVHALAYADGALYAGGAFTRYRGQPAVKLAKIDAENGVLDTTFTKSPGFNGDVHAIVVHGTSIIVGGDFTTYRSQVYRGLVKLDQKTGDLDPTFNDPKGVTNDMLGARGTVYALAVAGDTLFVGGSFIFYRTTSRRFLVKMSAIDGVADPGFYLGVGTAGVVRALHLAGGALYVGGDFDNIQGTTGGAVAANGLAKIDPADATPDATFAGAHFGASDKVYALSADATHLYVGGDFDDYYGNPGAGLVRVSLGDGTRDATFSQAEVFQSTDTVSSLLHDGGLYAAGSFGTYRASGGGQIDAHGVARLTPASGALDTSFTQQRGLTGTGKTLLKVGNTLYIGGDFRYYRGAPVANLAKFAIQTGALDATFSQTPSVNGVVRTIVGSSGMLYVGGDFTTYRSQPAQRLMRIFGSIGTVDGTFPPNPGFDGPVHTIHLTNEMSPQLWIGGAFTTYRTSTPAANVAKLNPADGTPIAGFSAGGGTDGPVYALIHDGQDALFIGGDFRNYRTVAANYIAKVHEDTGVRDGAFLTGATEGFNDPVRALADDETGSNRVLVGGEFTTYRNASGLKDINRLVLLNAVNGLVVSLSVAQPLDVDGPVSAFATGTSFFIAGGFRSFSWQAPEEIARAGLLKFTWPTYAVDPVFAPSVGFAPADPRCLHDNGALLFVGGGMQSYNGLNARGAIGLDLFTGDQIF
ncbi:MAG: delta-60 repeat domain-containing protein [Deltaproteobacteria bacterium]|nr:delta-60 repeat domain-containing protein [Deltaproteobacteria bacterium]